MAALLFLLWLGPEPVTLDNRVEAIELNIVYDGEGKETFRQHIFHDSYGDIIAWRIVKSEPVMSNGCLLFWDDGRLRRVRCGEYRVWHSQYDREIEMRSVLPTEARRGLSRVK